MNIKWLLTFTFIEKKTIHKQKCKSPHTLVGDLVHKKFNFNHNIRVADDV